MSEILVANLIDWSKSFVDENGTFYCGTTEEQKKRAVDVVNEADLVIYEADLHPVFADEFSINKGLYPAHNLPKPWEYEPDFVYNIAPNGENQKLGDKTLSPQLTETIRECLKKRKTGIIVPKEVYYQGGVEKAFCKPEDIEKTFEAKIITSDQFYHAIGYHDYIIAPKKYFDATRLDSDMMLPKKVDEGIPSVNYNVFSLLKQKWLTFPLDYKMTFVNTGVVEGICRLHTSIGLKQMYPKSRVINLTDATTPLSGIGLGYETAEQSRDACTRVCKDIGVEYMSTDEFLKEYGGRRE
ncbi:MAG: hypothetical protein ACE5J7_03995 [Candidatus Aenigmatarchaeota archaeon]